MYAATPSSRIGSALAAAALTALLGWALLVGLAGGAVRQAIDERLAVYRVPPPPPPPRARVVPRPKVSTRAEGRAAPPNIRSRATQVAAPVPVIFVPPPVPVIAAPKPFEGNQATQGAAERVGPGTGAGGEGDGTGSGGWGDGDGDGGEGTPPRWRRGRLSDRDFPRDIGELREVGFEGTVSVRFLVWTDGRVRECRVTRSSGEPRLDAHTCALIRDRMRYDPARDDDGRPVPSWILENHTWVIERDPSADTERRGR